MGIKMKKMLYKKEKEGEYYDWEDGM